MRVILLFIISIFLFCACKKLSPLQRLIHDADVVKVFVYSGDHLSMHYEINDVPAIQNWKNFIKDDTAITFNDCPREGKIIFKTSEDSTVMTFSMHPPCRYVSYELDGKKYAKNLSPKGRKFIDSLMRVE